MWGATERRATAQTARRNCYWRFGGGKCECSNPGFDLNCSALQRTVAVLTRASDRSIWHIVAACVIGYFRARPSIVMLSPSHCRPMAAVTPTVHLQITVADEQVCLLLVRTPSANGNKIHAISCLAPLPSPDVPRTRSYPDRNLCLARLTTRRSSGG